MATATLVTAVAGIASSAVPTAHDPIASVTWSRDVQPIIRARCTPCHYAGSPGGIPLFTYEDVKDQANAVKLAVLTRQMPPWAAARGYGAFRDDPSLTPHQVSILASWVEAGARPGDSSAELPASLSAPPTRDVTAPGRRLAVAVPPNVAADGRSSVVVTLPGSGQVNVVGWQFRPADPTLIDLRVRDARGSLDLAWTPAMTGDTFPAGTGYRVRLPATLQITSTRRLLDTAGGSRPPKRSSSSLELLVGSERISALRTTTQPCGTTAPLSGTLHAVRPGPVHEGATLEIRASARGRERVLALFRRVQPIHRFAYWLQEPVKGGSDVALDARGGRCTVELIVAEAPARRSRR
jgi:hypothetical protein